MIDYVTDTRRRLTELNRLEDERAKPRKSGRSALDSEAQIKSLRANILIPVLLQHDRLRARGWRSVAEVKKGVCSGCHMGLPSGTLLDVQREVMLVKCDHCGRFAFRAEEESVPAPPPTTAQKKPPGRRAAKD